jgi:hypothetical protein
MRPDTKIATCNYCGSRTILKLTARKGHELACGSCGAPIHDLKWLKPPEPASKPKEKYAPRPVSFASMPKPRKQKKRRKTNWKKGFKKAWDVLEDIFD